MKRNEKGEMICPTCGSTDIRYTLTENKFEILFICNKCNPTENFELMGDWGEEHNDK